MKNIFTSVIILLSILWLSCEDQNSTGSDINKFDSYFLNWSHYLGDPTRSHYSVLDQIDTNNVSQLELAWQYKSGGLESGRNTQIQTNPLIIGNKLFGVNAGMTLFCLNAENGNLLWEFKSENQDQTGLGVNRGLNYWRSELGQQDRIFFSSGQYLFAVDPNTGKEILSFGQNGSVDLRNGLGRDPKRLSVVANTPGAVYRNLLILGMRTHESLGAAPGHIRAYDVLTGEIKWTFYTIPNPGEYGHESWPSEAYKYVGGANNWAGMALDEQRGMVFIPTGSAAFDFYGGDRLGANLFANTLLALDAETGERIWHYQVVHHDLWDRDLPAPPNLLDITKNGKRIPVVAQVTKSGHVFVFHRETGEPVYPIEEKSYPPSRLKGEKSYPTQPLPTKPAPFSRQSLTEDDLYAPDRLAFVDDFVDHNQNVNPPTVREKFRQQISQGQFIPVDTQGVIIYPGFDGGAEWGGAAVDPTTGIMYVNSNEMAWIIRMRLIGANADKPLSRGATLAQIHCARCHGGQLQGMENIPGLLNVKSRKTYKEIENGIVNGHGAMPSNPHLKEDEVKSIVDFLSGIEKEDGKVTVESFDVPYAVAGFGRFKDDRGFPVVKPPWGVLNAINLNTGEYEWRVPLGHEKGFNDPNFRVSGTENYGGPVITSGCVLFIAATRDEEFRAFNMKTGKELWKTDLPAGGYATPASYSVKGKQYVVISCGGGKMGTKSGDAYLAFRLPKD